MARPPGIVGAILAGGVTSVAFTAILRVRAVVGAAGEGAIADHTLLAIGLFSMLVAALFLLGTRDFKRMLAYSSVEHMGILTHRRGARSGGRGGGAVSRLEQRPDQGRAVSECGQHPARGRLGLDGRCARHGRAHAALGGDFCRRHVRRHRLPALRAVFQRIEGGAGGARDRAWRGHRDVSGLPAAGLFRADPRGLRHCGRPPAQQRQSRRQTLRGNGGRDPATAGAARFVAVAGPVSPGACCTKRGPPPPPNFIPPHERLHSFCPVSQCHQPSVGGGARVAGG